MTTITATFRFDGARPYRDAALLLKRLLRSHRATCISISEQTDPEPGERSGHDSANKAKS